MAKTIKDKFIAFKCTAEAADRLRAAAMEHGVKLSAFVRSAACEAAANAKKGVVDRN